MKGIDPHVAELVSIISEKNVFQAKALDGLLDRLSPEECAGFSSLIGVYLDEGDTVEHLADCYLKHIQDFMEEEVYFLKNGHYRYSSSEEVNAFFYQNSDYMEYYMKGLAISTYLLDYHRQCRNWFCEKIRAVNAGDTYLDVGVGHGEYFALALLHANFKRYLGIDISPTCVRMCQEMVKRQIQPPPDMDRQIEIREQDFFQYDGPACDAVMLGEILEHVENPIAFLQKIHEITRDDSFIFITTAVNSPAKDHISLFKNVDEVENMYHGAGFDIDERLICPAHGYTVEKAVKKRTAIVTAHVLKRRPLF